VLPVRSQTVRERPDSALFAPRSAIKTPAPPTSESFFWNGDFLGSLIFSLVSFVSLVTVLLFLRYLSFRSRDCVQSLDWVRIICFWRPKNSLVILTGHRPSTLVVARDPPFRRRLVQYWFRQTEGLDCHRKHVCVTSWGPPTPRVAV